MLGCVGGRNYSMSSYEQGQKVLTFEQDYRCPDILMFGSSSIVEDEDEC